MNAPLDPSVVKPHERKGSLLRTVRAVAWSLIGLRKGSEYQQDVEKLNPCTSSWWGWWRFFCW